MENNLIDKNFTLIINDIIDKIFPNLIADEKSLVKLNINKTIEIMAYKFNLDDNIEDYYTVLKQNNNQHIYSIIKLFFPYIDDNNNFELFSKIEQFSDISIKKKEGMTFKKNPNLNPYLISTYQYSRYIPIDDDMNTTNKTNVQDGFIEYGYSDKDFNTSFYLLLETIEQCRSKMYINWLDIVPLTKTTYKNSRMYKNTFDYIDGIFTLKSNPFTFWEFSPSSPMAYNGGLSANDVFNGIHIYLYSEIFNSGAKWLMYEKQIKLHEKPLTYVEIINDLINISNFTFEYDSLDENLKKQSLTKWNNLKINDNDIYKNFIKCVMFKFDLNYCNNEIGDEYSYDYTSFYNDFKKINLDDEDEFLDFNKIDIDTEKYKIKLNDFYDKIPFSLIYDFFDDQIKKFSKTWYGGAMLSIDNDNVIITSVIDINENLKQKYESNENTFYLTYKNIYNYAKYLSKNVNDNITNITDARCLTFTMKQKFIELLNSRNKNFNINNVIKKTYINPSQKDIISYQHFISDNFKHTLKDNIFLIFISLGLLNEFKPNPSLTDKSIVDSRDKLSEQMKRTYIDDEKTRQQYLNTEYYLTRQKYKNLQLYKGTKQVDWFEYLLDKSWYNFFALSWISQINFYHHFLNNRVMFVTGSTGQGKSVVVPILFYYASIALNCNSKTKVLSTQALVAATTSNSKFMADNLGVPIDINGFSTFNSQIQYSTEADKHLVKGANTFIKEVTDRTLLEEIINNPLLKKPKGKVKEFRTQEYTDENLYDVVIIDEAHMHNTSMDLILSLIKNTVALNNQIKLVITSATMDDDEFIYRRFYKTIDENFAFPLSSKPLISNHLLPIDKNVIDRRFHISPPNETSRYTVTDIYLEQDTENYENSEAMGIATMQKILNTTDSGDILFFTTSTINVLKLTKIFNEMSPPNVIALPLYSKMREQNKNEEWFDTIKDIADNLPNIIYNKNDIIDIITLGSQNFETIPKNRYTRAIIIATNVVEASITIPTLKYVIDTGYSINIRYDSEKNQDILSTDKISEASRIQRRGRVGRSSSGTVYYMYSKGSHASILPEYELVSKDITFDIFKLLSNDANNLLFDETYHPQNFEFKKGNFNEFNNFILNEPNKNVKKIYKNQYSYNFETLFNFEHPFNNNSAVPINYNPLLIYDDGYGITNIFDHTGVFYIIHPGEQYIKRNVMTGKIIQRIENTLYLSKIASSINKIQFLKYAYVDKIFNVINVNKSNQQKNDKLFHKQKYTNIISDIIQKEGKTFPEITKNFPEEEIIKIFKTIFTANMVNNVDDIIKIISLTYSIGKYYNFVRERPDNPIKRDYTNFKKMWNSNVSELIVYRDIMNRFVTNFHREEDIIKVEKIDDRQKIFDNLVKTNGHKLFTNLDIINNSKLDKKEMKLFIESKNRRYTKDQRNEKFVEIAKSVMLNTTDIDAYCRSLYINTDTMKRALHLYNKFNRMIIKENIQEGMKKFNNIYLFNSTNKDENMYRVFLENYAINLSYYKDKKFANIISNNNVSMSTLSLVNFYEGYFFYLIDNDTEPLGLTTVSRDIVRSVINFNTVKSNIEKFDSFITQFPKPELITSKDKINDMNMNETIKVDLNFLKLRKYKLK